MGVIFLIVLIIVMTWREPIAGLLWRVLGPTSALRNALGSGTGNFFSVLASQASLVAQNNALRAELASSSVLVLDRNVLASENTDLKARLNRTLDVSSSTLAAVLERPPGVPYGELILDVGDKQGIAPGDMVAAGGSVYIGAISQVYPNTSRVVLYSAPGQTYDALLMSATTHTVVPVAVSGQGSGGFVAEVPAGTMVAVGDDILFPSITPQFFARVVYVESKEQESFKTIYMQLPVNPLELRYVEVRKGVKNHATTSR